MEITGRLTADASVKTLKDQRQVVTFFVALNNRYRTKEGELKDMTAFISCSYWKSTAIATHLVKGGIVTVQGNIGINAYKSMDGDFHAYLTFHVNTIQLLSKSRRGAGSTMEALQPQPETVDDLPF
jgi:single-strand DNA-binding protein